MKKVEHLSDFPKECLVSQYKGSTYADAVLEAEKSSHKYISYYEQKLYGRSRFSTILCSYIKEE